MLQGWPADPSDVPSDLREFTTFADELCVSDGLVFKGQRVVVPAGLAMTSCNGFTPVLLELMAVYDAPAKPCSFRASRKPLKIWSPDARSVKRINRRNSESH